MFHEIPELDKKGLRKFGLVTGAIVAALFAGFFPWLLERPVPIWPPVVTGTLWLWALVLPASLRPVYRGWMRFGMVLGAINTRIVLALVFYVVIMPIGAFMRLLGKDSMRRKQQGDSYRVASHDLPPERLERPY